jgi:hypothetical protein
VNVVDSWIETSFMAQLLIGVNVEKFSKMKACGRIVLLRVFQMSKDHLVLFFRKATKAKLTCAVEASAACDVVYL